MRMPESNIPRKKISSEVVTVMFTDMVEYTKKTAQLTRERFNELLNVFDNLAVPVIREYDGKIIKKIGDSFLVIFQSPTDAIICGIELQKTFKRYSFARQLQVPLQIRVAVHTGEVIHRTGDVYGDAVNTAARIESIAKPGQVVFSEPVWSVMNKNEVPYLHLGMRRLKGLKFPLRLFRVMTHEDLVRKRWREIRNFIFRLLLIGAFLGLIYLIFGFLWEFTDILPF